MFRFLTCSLLLIGTLLSAADTPPLRVPYTEFTLPNGLHVILHRDTSVPVVSAIRLNECPLPSTRTCSEDRTSSCSSGTEPGACGSVEKVMFPAQFVAIVHAFRSAK